MEKSLLRYTWVHSRALQIWIFAVIVASMPLYYYSLELPKQIINGPIQGQGFQSAADTQTFLRIVLPFSESLTGSPVVVFEGFEMTRMTLLYALCFVYTALLVLNGWFKLYINTYKGKSGERVLRRMRYEMFDRVLRFPVWRARQVKASEVAGIIKDEVDPLSEFIGDAFSAPLFLAGQALTALVFLFAQNTLFGILTVAVIGLQVWIIPRLRRRLLELGKQRQLTARAMAGRIGEVVQGIDDIHLNDTSNLARAEMSGRLSNIFFIRLELFKRKFSVKFLNNLLMQILSVIYYIVGGYFVISGRLDIGALVASISAYKDLPTPVKGLIDWDQQRLMAQQRYANAIEDFSRDDLLPAKVQDPAVPAGRIAGGFELRNVAFHEEGVSTRLENVTARLALGETVAIVAEPPQSATVFLELCVRLLSPVSGQILLDGSELKNTPEAVTGRSIGYADSGVVLPGGTIEDCLLEVLKNRPVPAQRVPGERTARETAWLIEARASGNSEFDVNDDWIDRARIGTPTDAALLEHIQHVARTAGLQGDILEIGLNSRIRAEDVERIAAVIGRARTLLRDKLDAAGLAGLVEQFHVARYNSQASVAENILFGMPVDPTFAPQALPGNAMVRDLLREEGLQEPLVSLGLEIARTFTDMFADLSSASPLFDQAAGMTPERIAMLAQVVTRVDTSGLAGAGKADLDELMALSMAYVEPSYRFGLLDEALKAKVLSARGRLHDELSRSAEPKVVFNDYDTYNPSLTIADNILFGRIETNLVGGRTRIIAAVTEVLAELGLSDAAFRAGLAFDVGTGGRALSEAQRQKLRLARALMKKPDFLVLNRACAALPPREQRVILEAVLADARERADSRPGIICAPADRGDVMLFDRVVFLQHGRVVEEGSPKVLLETRREFAKLVEG
ncbi:hypothetical protein MesoLjLc_61700 [Mesorhizobium sp. L-8-10]|uniref:ATP-binding cassette domain-containing protein n=1 Tax=unclassified Mesorhizobium TaxID=325217 RepID=UPI0019258749|nr:MULTISPECIES: ATP-binding cassette domain-containing protein [unclassified Mesorhizobium]BCH26251.1 hypothetical protein MesoLjLb_60360 [Mesorhizobium sp. L-8-3]BCH34240.1 hypothetical protein MesoLjLc_61700 [Mesorhizobium sp. L-8-10]